MKHARVLPRATRWLTCLAFLGLAGVPRVAKAQSTPCAESPPSAGTNPYLWLYVNSTCTDLSALLLSSSTEVWTVNTTLEFGGSTFDLNASFDVDPEISFDVTTSNFAAGPSTYTFVFSTAIDPGFYSNATSTGIASITNGASGTSSLTTSTTYPTFISGYGSVGLANTNLNVDLGTSPCIATGAPGAVTNTCNYGTATNTFAPTFYDNLEVMLTYQQDDAGSIATWSGKVTLNAITTPEPSSLILTASGLVSAALARRRRRSV